MALAALCATVSLGISLTLGPLALADGPGLQLNAHPLNFSERGSLAYGRTVVVHTKCWSQEKDKPTPELQVKSEGKWRTVDKSARTLKLASCPKKYPYAMVYRFKNRFEGQLIQGGEYAGQGQLFLREVYVTPKGKQKQNFYSVRVSY